MRILHVADISIPTVVGYTSRLRYIVSTQKALGLDPIVLTSPRHQSPDHRAVETLDGIRHHRSPYLTGSIPQEINILRQRVVEVARIEKPDIIHGHSSILCGIPAYAASRQLGIPCVYEIRAFWEDAAVDASTNSGPGSPKYESIRWAETRLAKGADALIGICQGIKDDLVARDIDPADIFIVPNGVDADKFVPLPPNEAVREKYGLQGKKVVAYIGTFAAFEGVRFLVQALIKLIKEQGRDDIRGLIIGEGATYEECKQLTVNAGLTDKILHPGRVPHSEVNGLYSIIDVLAYPRDSQRITELVTPLKPLEALAMEKAVVASSVGGLKELIQDDVTGLIHRAEDVNDLAKKITMLVDDPALRERLGKQGRQWILNNRQWRTIIGKEIDVYTHAKSRWARHRWAWQGLGRTFERIGLGAK